MLVPVGAHPIMIAEIKIRTANAFMMCFIIPLLTVFMFVLQQDHSIYDRNYQYTARTDIINKGPFRPDWKWFIIIYITKAIRYIYLTSYFEFLKAL